MSEIDQNIAIYLHKDIYKCDKDIPLNGKCWDSREFSDEPIMFSFDCDFIKALKDGSYITGFTGFRIYDRVNTEPRYILCAIYGISVNRECKTIGYVNKIISGISVYKKNTIIGPVYLNGEKLGRYHEVDNKGDTILNLIGAGETTPSSSPNTHTHTDSTPETQDKKKIETTT